MVHFFFHCPLVANFWQSVKHLLGLYDTDISISHRIPLSNNGESGSTSIRHPTIVVKFTNRRIRDCFYKARPKLKSYNISDIGLGRYGENNIFIQESLTEAKRKLLKKCLKFRKEQDYKFIWTFYFYLFIFFISFFRLFLID